MEVADGQQVGLARGEPFPSRRTLALGAVTVAAAVIGDATMAAVLACLDVTAEAVKVIRAVGEVFGRTLRIKMTVGDSAAPAPTLPGPRPVQNAPKIDEEDEATTRALADPEVQRFRQVLGGEVRRVRNLKE